MAISSKQIILYIKKTGTEFTVSDIARDLISLKKSKKSKSKKRKGKPFNEREIFSRIKTVLDALVSIGYLKKQRKIYKKRPEFKIRGNVRVNTSGNAILKISDEHEIVIWKEFVNNAHNNDLIEVEIIDYKEGYYYGKVTDIIERKRDRYFAKIVERSPDNIVLKLLDTPGNILVCSKRNAGDLREGDFAAISLKDNYIAGKQDCNIEKVYPAGEGHDVERIIIRHNLPGAHGDYRELEDIEASISESENKTRKDYRNLYTITIDGDSAKDFDDAISIEAFHDRYKLYVHIADVSAFVKKNSELDMEAQKRGTSFYLGNTVIPMLPESLSNDLCSLREGVDRLTLSVEIVFDKDGNEIECAFNRGTINVDQRLTYRGVDDIFSQGGGSRSATVLKQMLDLARILKKRRLTEGRIDLNLDDYELIYDGDELRDIEFARRLKSHLIIEEFMLSANVAVSRALTENDIPSLYRIHENISDEKLSSLERFFKTLGLKLDRGKKIGIALQNVVEEVAGKDIEQVVNFIILRSFMQAYYGTEPLGHFGLGFADYTHFTSPIRRYPDLIVHRSLKSLIDNKKSPYEEPELEVIGETSSDMERVAQNAERDLFRLISCRFMADKVDQTFEAVVSGVTKAGFFVSLLDKPVEGMVPLRYLTDDFYLVMEDEYSVVGRRLGKRYRLGDRLRVILRDVSIEMMRMDFEVVADRR